MICAFSLALQFLTRIPVPVRSVLRPEDYGRSVFFFPFVGLIIGLIISLMMAGLDSLFPRADPGVAAVLLLTAWVLITGGLHLDGLADVADAWIGGHGDRDKTLAIMKDPRSGPMAMMVVVLIMLAKFAALRAAVERDAWEMLVWTPVLGRSAMLLMMLTTSYVRPGGIGVVYTEHLPRRGCVGLLLALTTLVVLQWRWDSAALLVLLGIGFVFLRRAFLQRLGGTTGDTLGATCELTEASALLILVLLAA